MNNFVNAVVAPVAASTSAGGAQPSAPHWTEQSAIREDKAHMAQLVNSASVQNAQQAAPASQTARPDLRLIASNASADSLGRAELFAALDKLRNTPSERMPVAAAELMMKCYEYQFNIAAVTHASKNVEEGVQTMTTRT